MANATPVYTLDCHIIIRQLWLHVDPE